MKLEIDIPETLLKQAHLDEKQERKQDLNEQIRRSLAVISVLKSQNPEQRPVGKLEEQEAIVKSSKEKIKEVENESLSIFVTKILRSTIPVIQKQRLHNRLSRDTSEAAEKRGKEIDEKWKMEEKK